MSCTLQPQKHLKKHEESYKDGVNIELFAL